MASIKKRLETLEGNAPSDNLPTLVIVYGTGCDLVGYTYAGTEYRPHGGETLDDCLERIKRMDSSGRIKLVYGISKETTV